MRSSKYVCLFYLGLLGIILLNWTSCQSRQENSILVIAVEHLPVEFSICNSDDPANTKSGLDILCRESIRYTHSYTTSTQPAAAIGSLLTGQYPKDHQLRRSFDRVHSESVLISQVAQKKGYRTAFFSGSPSVLKKTGLSNYFDVFDDSIASQSNEFYVDLKTQTNQFDNWLSLERKPFFAMIYNAELGKINETMDDLSKEEKFNEDLFRLFSLLKQSNTWNNSYVILVGLNGNNKFNRDDESVYTNLHSENILVTTFVKPPRQKGDEGINWKNDMNISLADIGKTLKCFLRMCPTEHISELQPEHEVLNLLPQWLNQKTNLKSSDDSREILIESPSTWFNDVNKWAIIKNEYLFIQKNLLNFEFEYFNTLTDRNETLPLKPSEDQKKIFENLKSHLLSSDKLDQLNNYHLLNRLNYLYWSKKSNQNDLLLSYTETNNPLTFFTIKSMNKIENKNNEKKIQQLRSNLDTLKFKNTCAELLTQKPLTHDHLKQCQDDLFIAYINYKRASDLDLNSEKSKLNYDRLRDYYKNQITRESLNLALSNIWGLYQNKNIINSVILYDTNF